MQFSQHGCFSPHPGSTGVSVLALLTISARETVALADALSLQPPRRLPYSDVLLASNEERGVVVRLTRSRSIVQFIHLMSPACFAILI